MPDAKRRNFNERFVERMLARRPQDRPRVERLGRERKEADRAQLRSPRVPAEDHRDDDGREHERPGGQLASRRRQGH